MAIKKHVGIFFRTAMIIIFPVPKNDQTYILDFKTVYGSMLFFNNVAGRSSALAWIVCGSESEKVKLGFVPTNRNLGQFCLRCGLGLQVSVSRYPTTRFFQWLCAHRDFFSGIGLVGFFFGSLESNTQPQTAGWQKRRGEIRRSFASYSLRAIPGH